jgi:hypothetical protein
MNADTTFGNMTVYELISKVTNGNTIQTLPFTFNNRTEHIHIMAVISTGLSGSPRVQIPYPLGLELPQHYPNEMKIF